MVTTIKAKVEPGDFAWIEKIGGHLRLTRTNLTLRYRDASVFLETRPPLSI